MHTAYISESCQQKAALRSAPIFLQSSLEIYWGYDVTIYTREQYILYQWFPIGVPQTPGSLHNPPRVTKTAIEISTFSEVVGPCLDFF